MQRIELTTRGGFMGFLYILIFIVIMSLLFSAFINLLPYILIGMLLVWIGRQIVGWINRDNSSSQTHYFQSDQYTQSNQKPSNPDIIDVEFEQRDINE